MSALLAVAALLGSSQASVDVIGYYGNSGNAVASIPLISEVTPIHQSTNPPTSRPIHQSNNPPIQQPSNPTIQQSNNPTKGAPVHSYPPAHSPLVQSNPNAHDPTAPPPRLLLAPAAQVPPCNTSFRVYEQINENYNVIIITFASLDSTGAVTLDIQGPYEDDLDGLATDLAKWKEGTDLYGRERLAMVSVGGQNGLWPCDLSSDDCLAGLLDL